MIWIAIITLSAWTPARFIETARSEDCAVIVAEAERQGGAGICVPVKMEGNDHG